MNTLTKIALTTVSVAFLSGPAFASVPEVVHAKFWNHGDQVSISTDVSTIKAGKVDFQVANNSWNTVHEILVRKVTSFDDELHYNSDKDKSVLELEHNNLGEVAVLKPGQTGDITVNLTPGKYKLIGSVPGHYKDPLVSDLVVTK